MDGHPRLRDARQRPLISVTPPDVVGPEPGLRHESTGARLQFAGLPTADETVNLRRRAAPSRPMMRGYQPLVARTRTVHRPIGPMAYDCVKIIVVRDGSAFLFSEFGQQLVKPGDVVLLGANVLCGSEPEGHITVTTIYADTDFLLDQLRWQYAAFLEDRLDAQGFADTLYTEPAQILRLGEDRGRDVDAVAG